MVGRIAPAGLLLALVIAGCSGASDPAGTAPSSSASGTSDAALGNATLPRLQDPWRVTLYLNADGGLQPDVPPAGSVPIGLSLAGFASGFDPAVFAQRALGHAVLIVPEDVFVQLHVTSQGPQVSNTAFDAAVWFGSSSHKGLSMILTGQPALPPGARQTFEVTLEFEDKAPLFIEAEDEVTLAVTGSAGGETGEPHLLVGPEAPSFVEFTVRNYTVDPLEDGTAIEGQGFAGEVTNASGPTCASMEGSEMRHDVAVDAGAVLLRLRLSRTSSPAPTVDNDLQVYDGARLVASSTSIFPDETVLLAAEALDGLQGKTLGVIVHGCGPGPVQYELEIEQSTLPPI